MRNLDALLLVESGPPEKADYLAALKKLVPRVVLLKNSAVRGGRNDWARSMVDDRNTIRASFLKPGEIGSSVARWLGENASSLSRVACLTYQEEAVPAANELARYLGSSIVALDAEDVRDKWRMRRAWTGAGLPQPRSYRCGTLDDARRAVDELDGCCVVKPCGMMGSRGVSRIRGGTAAEIEEAYRRAVQEDFEEEDLRYAFGVTRLVLVEEYVEADLEISVKL